MRIPAVSLDDEVEDLPENFGPVERHPELPRIEDPGLSEPGGRQEGPDAGPGIGALEQLGTVPETGRPGGIAIRTAPTAERATAGAG